MASGRRTNDAMVGAKPYVDTVNWTKGIHASALERECDRVDYMPTPIDVGTTPAPGDAIVGAKPYVPCSLCSVSGAGGTWDLPITRISPLAIGLCPRTHTQSPTFISPTYLFEERLVAIGYYSLPI